MPIYEFTCPCGKTFEKIRSFSDMDKEAKCECGKVSKRNVVNKSNFHLKGNWFKTRGRY